MQGMWGRRRNLAVVFCSRGRTRSQRGNVVGVNDVVRQSWMVVIPGV